MAITEQHPAAATVTPDGPAPPANPPDPRRWLALAVIAVAQLMVVLDASIVIIALPSAQHALHISTDNRQWVITAYGLAFGGLLLLGGRIADFMGRKRMFVVGLLGFAAASALGGVAVDSAMLFSARALQGAFAALMAPAALSLITTTFTEPKERASAFGVYGAISGGGAAIGLIMGGVLTEFASWRWCLLVNVPISLLAAGAAVRLVRESRATGQTRYDIPGVVASSAGLVSLVYGFTKATVDGWGSPITLVFLAAAAVLLAAFVAIERRSTHPLLPLRVLLDRNRGGSFLASFMMGTAMLGMFLFLTYYFQGTLHYSALSTGFAFLPVSAGVIVGASAASRILPRVGPRALLFVGLLLGAVGCGWLTQLGVGSGYALHVLPAEILMSVGLGLAFVPMSSTALLGVDTHDAGVASAALNMSQQAGNALGTALLNTIYATAVAGYLVVHGTSTAATAAGQVHGYTVGFWVSTAVLAGAALVALLLVKASRQDLHGAPVEEPELALAPVG
ncbi:MAG: MFS transporter [Acidimicrobiales bacterium]